MTVTASCPGTLQEDSHEVVQRKYNKLQGWEEVKKQIRDELASTDPRCSTCIAVPCGPQVGWS